MSYNVIFFGAGASFGSDNKGTPPLGTQLFDALVDFDTNYWGKIPLDLASEFRNDFEEGMKKLPQHMIPQFQRTMAAYFFQFEPQYDNLYRKLARRIIKSKWEGILISINYERLLELSLISEGLQPVVGSPITHLGEIELCLPHGCCHLFNESVQGSSGMVSLAGFMVRTNGRITCISNPIDFQKRIQSDAFPPVMSYYEPQKRTTSGVGFIENQRRRFLEVVTQASNIGVIGIRVRTSDAHIWDPLSNTSARLIYCSGIKAGQEFQNWCNQKRLGKEHIIVRGYFEDCFDQFCKEFSLI
jgi:hypothetical protein